MIPRTKTLLLAVMGSALLSAVQAARGADAGRLFAAADLVPADVTVYIHVEQAAQMRANLESRPLGKWVFGRLVRGDVKAACDRLARAAGVSPERLFDATLGASFTLVMAEAPVRGDNANQAEPNPRPWAIISRSDRGSHGEALLDRIPKKLRGPLNGMALHEWREHDLVVGLGRGLLIVGPLQQPQLFESIVRAWGEPDDERLGADAGLMKARTIECPGGGAAAGIFIRHQQPMGGWSAIVASLDGDQLSLRHAARFDRPPFSSPLTCRDFDLAPLEALKDRAILAIIEPTDIGDGPLGTFLEIKWPIVTPELRGNLGSVRISMMGECDGRLQSPPVDLQTPTFTRCFAIQNPAPALGQFDRAMLRFAGHLKVESPTVGDGEVDPTAAWRAQNDAPRHLPLPPRDSAQVHPFLDRMSLNWCCIGGADMHWAIVSSDPVELKDVCRQLASEPVARPSRVGRWSNGGLVQGRRLAQHVRSWCDQAPLLVGTADAGSMCSLLQPIAELADGIDCATWSLRRPTLETMELEVAATLIPAEVTPPPRP